MSDAEASSVDPYARSEYRRLIAWEARLRREEPFLLGLLTQAPDRSVLDLGCGTGEHTAFFARQGARAVGLDRSESMIEQARDHEGRGEGRFFLGDALDARQALAQHSPFGLVICLGNMLPHVLELDELNALLEEVHGLLAPGGIFALQILNYERILDQDIRHLPVNIRAGEGSEELVFLRLVSPVSAERILFFPTTLALDPDADEPVSVQRTRRVELRPWTAADLVPALQRLGFNARLHGDMHGGDFIPADSSDLVVVTARA